MGFFKDGGTLSILVVIARYYTHCEGFVVDSYNFYKLY